MMALAYLMSLCSESDAFVAASFVAFGPGAQLAFLVFGPMVDTEARGAVRRARTARGSSARCVDHGGGDDARRHPLDPGDVRMMRWSAVRIGTGLVLRLLGGRVLVPARSPGRTSLYLSTRTGWLVPSGALLLTTAAIGRLATGACARHDPLTPSRDLGARRDRLAGRVLARAASGHARTPTRSADVASFVGIRHRRQRPGRDRAARLRRRRRGADVRGLREGARDPRRRSDRARRVRRRSIRRRAPDEFLLTRFIVTCCIADATIAQVRVVGVAPGTFAQDDWVRVEGRVYPRRSRGAGGRRSRFSGSRAAGAPVPHAVSARSRHTCRSGRAGARPSRSRCVARPGRACGRAMPRGTRGS